MTPTNMLTLGRASRTCFLALFAASSCALSPAGGQVFPPAGGQVAPQDPSTAAVTASNVDDGEKRSAFLPGALALSPDGATLVFAADGDLFAASSTGGAAVRLTAHVAEESRAAFAPDGGRLAFASDRDGATNLYIADVVGAGAQMVLGKVRRVTSSNASQQLGDFSADGTELFFSDGRERGVGRQTRMWRVSVDGGPVRRLTDALGALPRAAPDGTAVYFRRGRPNHERPAYRGSGVPSLWRFDLADGSFDQVARSAGSDGDAVPLADGSVLFLSSRAGQFELWRLEAGASESRGGSATRLFGRAPTADEVTLGHGLRDLAAARNAPLAAFCLWDGIYTLALDVPNAGPQRVDFVLSSDSAHTDVERIDLDREATEAALSPDGRTLAIVARGEVLVRDVREHRPTRRVTRTAARESDLVWSDCGTWLWFSSDDGTGPRIVRAAVALARADLDPAAGGSEVSETDAEAADEAADETADEAANEAGDEAAKGSTEAGEDQPKKLAPANAIGDRWVDALTFTVVEFATDPAGLRRPLPSPCGRWLLGVRGGGDLWRFDVASGAHEVVFSGWATPESVWAPDGRHIVYAVEDLDHNSDIWLRDLGEFGDATRTPAINLTRHPDADLSPALSADGKVLAFLSDRSANNGEYDVHVVYLDPRLDGWARYELDQHFADVAKVFAKRAPRAANAPTPAVMDIGGAHDAWRRAAAPVRRAGRVGNLGLSPAGNRILFSTSTPSGETLLSVDHRGENEKTLHGSAVAEVRVARDGSRAMFVAGNQVRSVGLEGAKPESHPIDLNIAVDRALERRQKFLEAARVLETRFYHPTLKGLDWARLVQRYGELAETTRTSADMNRVLGALFGELDGSHTGASGGPSASGPAPATGYLGVDAVPDRGGWRVVGVLPGGPAARPTSRIAVGDRIKSVDGEELCDASGVVVLDLYAALQNAAGQEVLLGVRAGAEVAGFAGDAGDAGDAVRFVLIEPITAALELDLRYAAEVQARRDEVERLSEGKLGYLHIRGMNLGGVRDFERDLFAAADGKRGLVIDVRDNGGGSTTDILLASLTAPVHAYTVPRGADGAAVPRDNYPRDRRLIHAYTRPIAVLINENSFSNAEIFAHAIKTIGRGRLIGVATFGGVISTGSHRLIDGTTVRVPFRGWYLPDGTDMENNGAQPHVEVHLGPADEVAGRDPQLEAAVADMLARLPQ